jgi:type II secretory pathway component PulL
MEEWSEQQHIAKELRANDYIKAYLESREEVLKGIFRRAKRWNLTFAILLTLTIMVDLVIAWSFSEVLKQMRMDSIEYQKSSKELRDYLSEKKKEDAKESKDWYENINKWSKR